MVLPKKELPHRKVPCKRTGNLEEVCESETSSCTEASTSTANILDRIIYDTSRDRKPVLRKWPPIYPQTEELDCNNDHQFKASVQKTHLDQMCFLRVSSDPNPFRQTAIVGTIGPACANADSILELLEAGMNVARVSMAHNDPCDAKAYFQAIVEASNRYNISVDFAVPIGVIMDLKGPEIRTGSIDAAYLKDPAVPELLLKKGRIVRLSYDKIFEHRCTEKIIYLDCEVAAVEVRPGMEIYISDRSIKLRVEAVENFHIVCRVQIGGTLRNYQQVHIPMLPLPLPPVTDYDLECLNLAAEMNVDIVVVPKIRNENTIYRVKAVLGEKQPEQKTLVFAKISNYEGLRNIDAIVTAADGIVIQKRDLSIEIAQSKIFIAVKEIIAKCNRAGKPVLCSVHLKTHNGNGPPPEVDSIAQCIVDGADCLLLTMETATGTSGSDDIAYLSDVMREAEAATMQSPYFQDLTNLFVPSVEPINAITMTAVEVASKINAAAILTVTTSGRTAHMLSWWRPRCPVIAVTRIAKTSRQLNGWRAVVPLFYTAPLLNDWFEDCAARIRYGIEYGKYLKMIKPGDALILVTGFRKKAGFTNCLRVVFASLDQNQFVDNTEQYFAAVK